MPYALRHTDGRVLSLHRDPEAGAEFLPADHPELQSFVGAGGTPTDFSAL